MIKKNPGLQKPLPNYVPIRQFLILHKVHKKMYCVNKGHIFYNLKSSTLLQIVYKG